MNVCDCIKHCSVSSSRSDSFDFVKANQDKGRPLPVTATLGDMQFSECPWLLWRQRKIQCRQEHCFSIFRTTMTTMDVWPRITLRTGQCSCAHNLRANYNIKNPNSFELRNIILTYFYLKCVDFIESVWCEASDCIVKYVFY